MIWLRLNRAQFGLASLAGALLVGAIAALVVPSAALPEAEKAAPAEAEPVTFEVPIYAIANDPTSPLVERNPFDPERRPPAQRLTSTSTQRDENALLQSENPAINFILLGTVVTGTGRNIAVIQGNPESPMAANYHVGDEPAPGYRLTRIGRNEATIVGPNGQPLDLTVQKPATTLQTFE